jgi:ubiquinone/menaquinone biosynthesis C-methylase UbiE
MMQEYDSLAYIYDLWSTADPVFLPTHDFYVNLGCESEGCIIELGVGTGRIAIDIARKGKKIIGIDCSSIMLEQCAVKIKQNGLEDKILLVNSDISSFKLENKANLIIFPFRSIGHLLNYDERRKALENIYSQLLPGGRFIFDHYIFDRSWAESKDGVQRLMYSGKYLDGHSLFIWDTYRYDFDKQFMQCYITVEKTDKGDSVVVRKHYPLSFSWIYPEQMRALLEEVGFRIISLYGDFSYEPFNEHSSNQIWVAMRPE